MNSEVYEGKEGWLFLIGGSNSAGALYHRDAPLLPDAKLHEWVKLIEDRARRLEAMGIRYAHLSIPEKLTIYDDKFKDPPIVDWTLSPALRLGEMLQRSPYAHVWVDLISPLRSSRDQEQIYLKTDTHWAAPGCFLTYKLVCERIGIEPEPDLLSRPYLDYGAYMDLGAKLNPPVPEVFKFYDFAKNSARTYANPIAQYLETVTRDVVMHVGSHVAFRNKTASAANKKLLIFGDSCASQRMDALTGMLAETAKEVEFIWSSSFDWGYIKRARPDVVIYELAERFLTKVPRDNLRLRWVLARQGLLAKWLRYQARGRVAPAATLV